MGKNLSYDCSKSSAPIRPATLLEFVLCFFLCELEALLGSIAKPASKMGNPECTMRTRRNPLTESCHGAFRQDS